LVPENDAAQLPGIFHHLVNLAADRLELSAPIGELYCGYTVQSLQSKEHATANSIHSQQNGTASSAKSFRASPPLPHAFRMQIHALMLCQSTAD